MNKIILSVVFFTLSCASNTKINNANFEVIYKSSYLGKSEKGFELIQTYKSYCELIKRLELEEVEDEDFFDIDFSNQSILVVYLGERNTGGYSIDISNIYWNKNNLIVQTSETKPQKGEMVTMAITNPYCIVKIPKTSTVILK